MSLTANMRRRLAAVGSRQRATTEERDAAIVAAVNKGGTLREVAAVVGLSHPGVHRIVAARKRTSEATPTNNKRSA